MYGKRIGHSKIVVLGNVRREKMDGDGEGAEDCEHKLICPWRTLVALVHFAKRGRSTAERAGGWREL